MGSAAGQPPIPELVAAGAARVPATAVVRGGRLVNVVSSEVYPADVAAMDTFDPVPGPAAAA